MSAPTPSAQTSSAGGAPTSPYNLFATFNGLALQGFGGVLAVAQHVLVDQQRWLTRQEYLEILSVAQALPGPNVCNVALMIGDRFFGWRGAFAALAGMITVPLIIVLALVTLYANFSSQPQVAGALKGMGAVAAGMIMGSALKLAPALRNNPMGLPLCALLAATVFVMTALLRWPLVWVLLGVGLPACAVASFMATRARNAAPQNLEGR
jgi:chromate transporter